MMDVLNIDLRRCHRCSFPLQMLCPECAQQSDDDATPREWVSSSLDDNQPQPSASGATG